MTEKFTLYMGLNDKDSKRQEVSTLEAYKIAMNIIKKHCDGGTIFEADGFYTHDDGSIVIEKTLRIELMFIDKATAKKVVEELKTTFNQESIAVQQETINSDLW